MSSSPSVVDRDAAPAAPQAGAGRSWARVALLALLPLLALLLVGVVVGASRLRHGAHVTPVPLPPRSSPLPTLGAIPAFTMRDQRDRVVTDQTLRGAVNVVDFFFTSCPIACPRLMARMEKLGETLEERGVRGVRLVSITVDPENDTPPKLAEYASRYHADADRWWYLTGEADQLARVVVQGFKVSYTKADPSTGIGEIMHGNWFVLVDARGEIRGYYATDDADRLRELVDDAQRLASDAR